MRCGAVRACGVVRACMRVGGVAAECPQRTDRHVPKLHALEPSQAPEYDAMPAAAPQLRVCVSVKPNAGGNGSTL